MIDAPPSAPPWQDLGELVRHSRSASAPWLLVEVTREGLAVGPWFGPGTPCFSCYLRRLDSTANDPPRPLAEPAGHELLLRRAEDLLRDLPDGRQLVLVEGRVVSQHQLFPVPGCPCAEQWRGDPRLGPDDLVSPRLGVLTHLRTHDGGDGHVLVTAHAAPRMEALGKAPLPVGGLGCHRDAAVARAIAISEAVERYCAGFVVAPPTRARRDDLDGLALPVDASRFADHPVSNRDEIAWVAGRSLARDAPVWVPAASVHLPYRAAEHEPGVTVSSSEGLACDRSGAVATTRAVLELVERDTYVRAWRARRPMTLLPDRSASGGARHALLWSRYGVPVVAAMLEQDRPPYCAVGLAARLTIEQAREASLSEALAASFVLSGRTRGGSVPAHASDPALTRERAARLTTEAAVLPPDGPAGDVADLVTRLPPAAVVDVTTADAEAVGLRVVRVVVDGFVGLDPVDRSPRLAGDPTPLPLL